VAVTQKIKAFADKKGCTNVQICLAWLLHQDALIFPLPGSTRPEGVKEALAASQIKLSKEELQELRVLAESAQIAGRTFIGPQYRYTTPFQKGTRQSCGLSKMIIHNDIQKFEARILLKLGLNELYNMLNSLVRVECQGGYTAIGIRIENIPFLDNCSSKLFRYFFNYGC